MVPLFGADERPFSTSLAPADRPRTQLFAFIIHALRKNVNLFCSKTRTARVGARQTLPAPPSSRRDFNACSSFSLKIFCFAKSFLGALYKGRRRAPAGRHLIISASSGSPKKDEVFFWGGSGASKCFLAFQGSRKNRVSEFCGKRSGRHKGSCGKQSAPQTKTPCRDEVGL